MRSPPPGRRNGDGLSLILPFSQAKGHRPPFPSGNRTLFFLPGPPFRGAEEWCLLSFFFRSYGWDSFSPLDRSYGLALLARVAAPFPSGPNDHLPPTKLRYTRFFLLFALPAVPLSLLEKSFPPLWFPQCWRGSAIFSTKSRSIGNFFPPPFSPVEKNVRLLSPAPTASFPGFFPVVGRLTSEKIRNALPPSQLVQDCHPPQAPYRPLPPPFFVSHRSDRRHDPFPPHPISKYRFTLTQAGVFFPPFFLCPGGSFSL